MNENTRRLRLMRKNAKRKAHKQHLRRGGKCAYDKLKNPLILRDAFLII